jgi:UV DNA damage repair endonuclease
MRDRHHADYIDRETWESFTRDFEDMREIDVMMETKKKELSVLKAREYDLSRKGE